MLIWGVFTMFFLFGRSGGATSNVRKIREFIFIIRESSRRAKVRRHEANIRRESVEVVNDRYSSIRAYISHEFEHTNATQAALRRQRRT